MLSNVFPSFQWLNILSHTYTTNNALKYLIPKKWFRMNKQFRILCSGNTQNRNKYYTQRTMCDINSLQFNIQTVYSEEVLRYKYIHCTHIVCVYRYQGLFWGIKIPGIPEKTGSVENQLKNPKVSQNLALEINTSKRRLKNWGIFGNSFH